MSSDPKPVGGQWHKAARGELSPPKGASEETLVPQLFTAHATRHTVTRDKTIKWLLLLRGRIMHVGYLAGFAQSRFMARPPTATDNQLALAHACASARRRREYH